MTPDVVLTPPSHRAGRRQVVIGGLGLVQIIGYGSSYYLLAVLAAPIVADTDWPLSWVVGAFSAGLLVAGMVSPHVGRTIARHGGRPVLAVACVLLALGLSILGLAPSLPVFVAGWLVLGVGMGTGLYDAAFATLGRLYRETARPAITALTLWGGFASTICWPLSAYLVDHLGWRGACFTYAAIQIGVSLPLILFTLPSERVVPIEVPATSSATAAPLTATEWRLFLWLAIVFTVAAMTEAVVSVHLLRLLQARGLTLAGAVSLGALIGPSQVLARLIELVSGGRHHPLWTLTAALILMALGLALLASGFPFIALAVVLYGAGIGIDSIARGTLPLALFGPGRYAPLVGRLARPSLVAQAIAPPVSALIVAQEGGGITLILLAGFAVANVVLVAALWIVALSISDQRKSLAR